MLRTTLARSMRDQYMPPYPEDTVVTNSANLRKYIALAIDRMIQPASVFRDDRGTKKAMFYFHHDNGLPLLRAIVCPNLQTVQWFLSNKDDWIATLMTSNFFKNVNTAVSPILEGEEEIFPRESSTTPTGSTSQEDFAIGETYGNLPWMNFRPHQYFETLCNEFCHSWKTRIFLVAGPELRNLLPQEESRFEWKWLFPMGIKIKIFPLFVPTHFDYRSCL